MSDAQARGPISEEEHSALVAMRRRGIAIGMVTPEYLNGLDPLDVEDVMDLAASKFVKASQPERKSK